MDEVLGSRERGRWRRLQYLVKWSGHDRLTWEDTKSVNGPQAIDSFHALCPGKSGTLPDPPG